MAHAAAGSALWFSASRKVATARDAAKGAGSDAARTTPQTLGVLETETPAAGVRTRTSGSRTTDSVDGRDAET